MFEMAEQGRYLIVCGLSQYEFQVMDRGDNRKVNLLKKNVRVGDFRKYEFYVFMRWP